MGNVIKIGFDIGGVLSKYPDILLPIVRALVASPDIEVHVLSDMSREKIVDMLVRNALPVRPEHVHACDYAEYGERCKAVEANDIGLDVLVDDFMGYLAMAGAPPLRLLSMPDPDRDYFHETWKTDGSEGNFGRRKKA